MKFVKLSKLKNLSNIRFVVVTRYYKFHHCSKSMCSSILHALWTLFPVPVWRNYRMRARSESSQPWLPESIVTQPWVKPHAGTDCWRRMLRLKMSLRFATARFANLGELDEILQLGTSEWHSMFCKSYVLFGVPKMLRSGPPLVTPVHTWASVSHKRVSEYIS